MTRKTSDLAIAVRQQASRTVRPLLFFLGAMLLILSVSASPLEAADRENAAVQTMPETPTGTTDGQSVAFADRAVPDPQRSYRNGRWVWRVPETEWRVGVLLGLIFAAWLLIGLVASLQTPSLIEAGVSRRGIRPGVVASLARDPLAWIFLIAAGGLAGAIYSGSFGWLSSEATERVAGVVRWAPTGLLGFLGLVFGGGLKRRMSRWKPVAGDPDALMKMLEAESNSFLELVRVHIDDRVRVQLPRLARQFEVGLIQRAVWSLSERAVDQGRLEPARRDELLSGLLTVQPGRGDRAMFSSRLAALEIAVTLVDIDELTKCLQEAECRRPGERRVSAVRDGVSERRIGQDRRVRSIWRPHGNHELELAG